MRVEDDDIYKVKVSDYTPQQHLSTWTSTTTTGSTDSTADDTGPTTTPGQPRTTTPPRKNRHTRCQRQQSVPSRPVSWRLSVVGERFTNLVQRVVGMASNSSKKAPAPPYETSNESPKKNPSEQQEDQPRLREEPPPNQIAGRLSLRNRSHRAYAGAAYTGTGSSNGSNISNISTNGNSNNNSNSNNNNATKGNGKNSGKNSSNNIRKFAPGEEVLDRMMALAEYEVHVDPYRGIFASEPSNETAVEDVSTDVPTKVENGNGNHHVAYQPGPSPWKACQMAGLQTETLASSSAPSSSSAVLPHSGGDSDSDSAKLVRHVMQSSCPCLTQWTTEAVAIAKLKNIKARKRKRKGTAAANALTINDGNDNGNDGNDNENHYDDASACFGTRPADPIWECACDYNPFCLVTLGGAMNEILLDRYRALVVDVDVDADADADADRNDNDHSVDGINEHDDCDTDEKENGKRRGDQNVNGNIQEQVTEDADGWGNNAAIVIDDSSSSMAAGKPKGATATTTTALTPSSPKRNGIIIEPELDHTKKGSIYLDSTVHQLKTVRRSVWVDVEPIREYLRRTLQGLTAVASVDDCMSALIKRHSDLVFVNPLLEDGHGYNEMEKENSRMLLSMPPGIENLGATCYLNTQLQCLAQNQVFLDGIFSWTPDDQTQNDRMGAVISLFQSLLANLAVGQSCTIRTNDFSNALGLDHFEQQDPNEFSRLLLERMHDSFQGGAEAGPNQGGHDLATLLPHLFQGVITYETTCLTCQNTSRRSEEFMDLNLPIVHPSDITPRKVGQQSILEAFVSSADTDLQFCLDRYCFEEIMDGDNQYHCSQCDCKRDAKRELTFQKLPPVLNVQLSRYVFDRVNFQKKKLSDKVLLPTVMQVKAKGKERKAEPVIHRYILCAVMRHKGTSAYSGHYVAEAMDWLTGQWFEFNDDKVTLLAEGPSCCYDPSASTGSNAKAQTATAHGGKKRKTASVSGSEDAYNMYYVEESFLAQAALESLRPKASLHIENGGTPLIIEKIGKARKDKYSDIRMLCLEDASAADRLEHRREKFHEAMVPEMFDSNPDDFVWVHADVFRRFVSCQDRLEDEFVQTDQFGTILKHNKFLCSHRNPGIHPFHAREGKLLPRRLYQFYVSTLEAEQLADQGIALQNIVNDCVVTRTQNLFCQECVDQYRSKNAEVLDLLKNLKYLWEELDPKENDVQLHMMSYKIGETDEDRFVYAVSRKFITRLRNAFARLMKKVGSQYAGGVNVPGGLDILDLSEFWSSSGSGDDGMDPFVNQNLACEHGNLAMRNKRSIRYVPWKVWSVLKRTFPDAIELKMKRRSLDEPEDDDLCQECIADTNNEEHVKSRLVDLAQYCLQNPLPQCLCTEELMDREASGTTTSQYRLLHQDDMSLWHLFLTCLGCKNPSKISEGFHEFIATASSLQRHDFDIFSPDSTEHLPTPSDSSRLRCLSNIFRPIVCRKHRLPISSALESDSSDRDSSNLPNVRSVLSERVIIMEESAYQDFLARVAALTSVIFPSSDEPLHIQANRTPTDEVSDGAVFNKQWKIDSHHPIFRPAVHKRGPPVPGGFIVSSDTMSMCFDLDCATCKDDACNLLFQSWQDQEDATSTKGSKGSDSSKTSKPRMSNASGAAAHDPIQLDSDFDDDAALNTFSLRVFETEGNADEQSALTSLVQCAGLPAGDTTADDGNVLRRSSRKRKSRYPVGVIKDEKSVKIAMHHNIAAIRLKIFETCDCFNLEHSLKLVISSPSSDDKGSPMDAKHDAGDNPNKDHAAKVVDLSADTEIETTSKAPVSNESSAGASISEGEKAIDDRGPAVINLSFDLVSQTLLQVCESSVGSKLGANFNPADDLVFLHQHTPDESSSTVGDTELMGYLISLSNLTDTSAEAPPKKNGRRAVTEKGFSGTFLSSAPKSAPNKDPTKAAVEDPKAIEIASVKSAHSQASAEDDTGEWKGPSVKKAKLDKKSGSDQWTSLNGRNNGDEAAVNRETNENGHVHNLNTPEGKQTGIHIAASGTRGSKKSIQDMLEDSDGDDELLEGGLTSPSASKGMKSSPRPSNPVQKRDAGFESLAYAYTDLPRPDLRMNTMQLLMELHPNLQEGDAWNASRWAFDTYTEERNMRKLAHKAYAQCVKVAKGECIFQDSKEVVSGRDKAFFVVVQQLLETAGANADPDHTEMRFSAARWAIDKNPGMESEELLDLAYAKFLELTLD